MKEYNKLTQELLAQGYTAENYPDYVRISTSRLPGNDPLYNLDGGFEYQSWYLQKITYKTGCGMYVKAGSVINDMNYQIRWSHENDNPVIRCPYDIQNCPKNDSRLHGTFGGGLCVQCFCACHSTDEPYDYEKSFEKAEKEREAKREQLYQEYKDAHNGRVCRNHMFFDERKKEWKQNFDPARCASVCYSHDGYCPILGKELSKKKGNVYFDVLTTRIRKEGSLFDGEVIQHLEKGVRFFKSPVRMDICDAFVKCKGAEEIFEKKYRWESVSYNRLFDPTYNLQILNVRAESKPSRDLMQDLEDIRNGISISHASDIEKSQKIAKRERRTKRKQDAIRKLEKKIIENGYDSLEEFSLDRRHAEKWFSEEHILELEKIREEKRKEALKQPVQMSLFSM